MSCCTSYMEFREDKRWRYWYDRSEQSWAVQELDEHGDQIHPECEYFANKNQLLMGFPFFKFKPEPTVDIQFSISMELLRHYIRKGKRWKVMGIRMCWKRTSIMQYLSDEEWDQYQELIESARESI